MPGLSANSRLMMMALRSLQTKRLPILSSVVGDGTGHFTFDSISYNLSSSALRYRHHQSSGHYSQLNLYLKYLVLHEIVVSVDIEIRRSRSNL